MIKVFVNVKSAGKRKPALSKAAYELPKSIHDLRSLITAMVNIEVTRYNHRETDAMLLPYLTESQIEDKSVSGKVDFGRIYSEKKADPEKAVQTALQGFEDGLFLVLLNDTELKTLNASMKLCDGDTLTFIRLTFLAGRLW